MNAIRIMSIMLLVVLHFILIGCKKDMEGRGQKLAEVETGPPSLEAEDSGGFKVIDGSRRVVSLPPTAEILFMSNRHTKKRRTEIYAMDADGKNAIRLTFTNEYHFIAGTDRSRRYMVVSRAERDTHRPSGLGPEDRRSLWVLDLKTKLETRLTDPANHAEGDSFSPDGEWIVFHMKLSGQKQSDIYKIRRDGTALTCLTNTPTALEGDPTWSNDGKEIAFAHLDGKTRRFVLKAMDPDGRNIRMIYDGGKGVSTPAFPPGNYDPSWSPDDEWLVFERCIKFKRENWGNGIWHIFKVRRDGSEVVDLSLAGGHTDRAEYLPSYLPDGKRIVFGCFYKARDPRQSLNDIIIMDTNGKGFKKITTDPKSDKDMRPFALPSLTE